MKPKIIVIGAGLAGLTAAYRLQQKNHDVEVFEAQSRVGGRVHSVLMENLDGDYSIAELGGQNILDGGEAKYFQALAHELKIELQSTSRDFGFTFYDGQNFIDNIELLKNLNLNEQQIEQKLSELAEVCPSMQEVLDEILPIQASLKRMFSCMLNAYEGSPPHLLSTYHNITTLKYMLLGGLSAEHMKNVGDSTLDMRTVKNGNATLPLKLAEKLGDRLHLNKVLQQVSYNQDKKIILEFKDKTTVSCDKLLLAIPAIVYEDIHFHNIIDKAQLSLIKKMQYGKNAKIIIPAIMQELKNESLIMDNMITFFSTDKKLLTLYFNNDDGEYSFKNTLFTEQLPLLKQGLAHITMHTAAPSLATPEQFKEYQAPIVKSWVDDPYTKGSYSNYSVGLKDKLDKIIKYKNIWVKEIFMPVDDQVFFIGEHATLLAEIGTMEAAVESGERITELF